MRLDENQPVSECAQPAVVDRWQWPMILILSALVTAVFVSVVVLFARQGDPFLERRDNSVGEVLMREGTRLEEGKMFSLALETYEKALSARFHGKHHRTSTLERAGGLLWREGRLEEAAAYFARALEGAEPTLAPYAGLVDSLIRLERLDEAQQALDAWQVALQDQNDPQEQAKACHAAAELLAARQDFEGAVQQYEMCLESYGYAPSAGRLGALYAERGEPGRALPYLEQYFLLGAPGEDNTELYVLYSRLVTWAATARESEETP